VEQHDPNTNAPTPIAVAALHTPEGRRALDAAVAAAADARPRLVRLDMAAVDDLDSDGVAVLLACVRTLAARGGRLDLINVCAPLRVLFELTRLHLVFPDVEAPASRSPRRSQRAA
jgi:anti-anti-sigma factor